MTSWRLAILLSCAFGMTASACGDDDGDDDVGGPDGGGDAGNRDSGTDGGGSGIDAGGRDGGMDASSDASIDASTPAGDGGVSPLASFFVTSDRSMTGNLGGIAGADGRCQRLAAAVGLGSKTWRAYLSVERDPGRDGGPSEARSRIGNGPWYNVKGQLIANDLASLHARTGNAELFIDEKGQRINGQWDPTMTPNEHDVLTGTLNDGGVAIGATCSDWTSSSDAGSRAVGHSDGLGPMMTTANGRDSWFGAHIVGGCHDTTPAGGAGKLYCFAVSL